MLRQCEWLRAATQLNSANAARTPSSRHQPRRTLASSALADAYSMNAASEAYIYIPRLDRILVPERARAFTGWPCGGVQAWFQTNATSLL
jgi:hypothetical protein